MKQFKKFVAAATLVALTLSSIGTVEGSVSPYSEVNGVGYAEGRNTPTLTPAIALGAIAAVTIIAVALQRNSGHSSHNHEG